MTAEHSRLEGQDGRRAEDGADRRRKVMTEDQPQQVSTETIRWL